MRRGGRAAIEAAIGVTGAILIALFAVAGCSRSPQVPADSASTPETPMAGVEEVSLVPVTFEQWERELESRRGEIVVVDLWATWCIPCLERFPHTVEMYEEYGPRGVSFLSLSLDGREDELALDFAREFLTEQGAAFPNFLIDDNITDAFEKLDILGIPAVFVYSPDGELAYRLTGDDPNDQFTNEDVEMAIRALLGEADT